MLVLHVLRTWGGHTHVMRGWGGGANHLLLKECVSIGGLTLDNALMANYALIMATGSIKS